MNNPTANSCSVRRPNWLDWQIYRLFRWWWNPILRRNDWAVYGIENELRRWRVAKHDFMKDLS